MADGRDNKGRFTKGNKGSSTGRPPKVALAKAMKADIVKLKTANEKIEYLMNYLIDNVTDKSEMFKVVKEFLPYIRPKLKNVETKEHKISRIEMCWVDSDNKTIDVTNTSIEDK